jgi:hypothetical protein
MHAWLGARCDGLRLREGGRRVPRNLRGRGKGAAAARMLAWIRVGLDGERGRGRRRNWTSN